MRNYKRKHTRNPDRRMAAAVRLRAAGLSLRQIATELGVKSPQTVANDLARWEREHSNVAPLVSKTGVQKSPRGGEKWTGDLDSELSNVVSLGDRKAAG